MHRYVMHGILWCWHESHHRPRDGRFERNDLFAAVFSLPAIALLAYGAQGRPAAIAVGLGITAYGAVYSLFHDGLVHRRFTTCINPESRFWKPRIQAHKIHHAVHTKDGCVSFGFLVVRSTARLKHELARVRGISRTGQCRES